MRPDGNPQPDATPEQQQEAAADGLRKEFDAVNAMEAASSVPSSLGFGSSGSFFGRTNFEGRELNAMLDLIETANPEDLEQVSNALSKAKDALNEAARELDDYLKKTDWEGESGREFRRYGSELTQHAWEVATFANAAATQMSVASTGLASVRSSRPPRDTRLVRKRPEDFTSVERTDGNPSYQEAQRVEKHRQEAINQMNRLASFYAVSEQNLASQKAPLPPKPVRAAVPKPSGSGGTTPANPGSTGSASVGSWEQATPGGEGPGEAAGASSGATGDNTAPSSPAPGTSVQIDTVAAPPAPGQTSVAPPTATAPAGPPSGPAVPPVGVPGGPLPQGTQRPAGQSSGTQKTTSPSPRDVGRPGQTTTGHTPAGRPGTAQNTPTATGRPGPVGRPGVQGSNPPPAGRPTSVARPNAPGSGPAATGRPGVGTTQQVPITGRPSSSQPSAHGRTGTGNPGVPRSGRADGIVGGTPQRAATGSTSGSSRLPRGGVIGSELPPRGSAATTRPGQQGVIGAQPTSGGPRGANRGTPATNGIVGVARNSATGPRPGSGVSASGGTGLAGGRPNQQRPQDKEQARAGDRPDYLTEDEETWESRRRSTTPPVID